MSNVNDPLLLCTAVASIDTVATVEDGAAKLRAEREKANYRFGYVTPWVDEQGSVASTLKVVCVFATIDGAVTNANDLPLLVEAT